MYSVFHFSNKPAFPLKDGGCIAISSILKSLLNSEEVRVFHFTLATHKHPFDKEEFPISWLQNMEIDSAFVNTKINPFHALLNLILGKSYNVQRFYSKKVVAQLQQLLDKNPIDIAILESAYLLPYLDVFKQRGIKTILRAHNVEHLLWNSLAENSPNWLKRWYLKTLSKQLKKVELAKCKDLNGIISITEEDALFFHQFEPNVQTTSIPPIINPNEQETDYDLSDFYFLGAMDWQPNIEGVEWLLKKVIPSGLKDNKFVLAGRNLSIAAFSHPDLINVGEVDNATEFIKQHGICLIPLHSGGGLKLKLLENMAMGKPIISTEEGIRGVGVTHEKEVLIAKSAEEFKENMNRLQLDKELRKKLGTNSKTFIQNNFNEDKLTRRLIAFIKDIS